MGGVNETRLGGKEGKGEGETYTAPPRQVVVIVAALVEGDEQVGALVAVGEREFGRAHLGSGCFCFDRKEMDNRVSMLLVVVSRFVSKHGWSCQPTAGKCQPRRPSCLRSEEVGTREGMGRIRRTSLRAIVAHSHGVLY